MIASDRAENGKYGKTTITLDILRNALKGLIGARLASCQLKGTKMFKRSVTPVVILFAGLISVGLSAPAKADVYYDVTLQGTDGGSGTLTLNFSTLAATDNIGYTSITPYFVNLNVNADSMNFLITPSILQDGAIQTSPTGSFYTLTLEEVEPAGDSTGGNTLFLDLYTGSWQIHGQYNSTVASGNLSVTGPYLGDPLSATPLPATLPLFAGGLGLVGLLSGRKKRKVQGALAAA